MGYSISWVCFRDLPEAEVLRRTSLRNTGIVDEANAAPFSLAPFPHGWIVLWSNDIFYATAERMAELSHRATLIAGQAEEHVMYCGVSAYEDGREIWSVEHDAQKGPFDIEEKGRLPSQYAAIRAAKLAQQKDGHGESSVGVDWIFDIPVSLCAALTGFEYARYRYDWGEPRFMQLAQAQLGR